MDSDCDWPCLLRSACDEHRQAEGDERHHDISRLARPQYRFASDLMNQPLKVLCEHGGWKTAQTVLQRYRRADEGQLRKALEERRVALS